MNYFLQKKVIKSRLFQYQNKNYPTRWQIDLGFFPVECGRMYQVQKTIKNVLTTYSCHFYSITMNLIENKVHQLIKLFSIYTIPFIVPVQSVFGIENCSI